jgi:hypothetical protein
VARQAVFHFPDRTEIRYLEVMPEAGEVVASAGVVWVITGVHEDDGGFPSCTLVPERESNDGRERPEEAMRTMPPSIARHPRARPTPT